MKNLKRAALKKLRKQFRPGDVVTWGDGRHSGEGGLRPPGWVCGHRIVEVRDRGVVVECEGYVPPGLYVAFDGNARHGTMVSDGSRACGTLRHVDQEAK